MFVDIYAKRNMEQLYICMNFLNIMFFSFS